MCKCVYIYIYIYIYMYITHFVAWLNSGEAPEGGGALHAVV